LCFPKNIRTIENQSPLSTFCHTYRK